MQKKTNTAITGSLVIKENNLCYNRLIFAYPNGKLAFYNKRHTFTLAGEHKVYTAGNEKVIIDYKGWKICPQICYDLRFPVFSRNVEDYHLLVYVANWPKARITAWDALLRARAIENMAYCIGVNRVGTDGLGYHYPGHTAAFDVLGNRIDNISTDSDTLEVVILDKNNIKKYREKLQFLKYRDAFSLTM